MASILIIEDELTLHTLFGRVLEQAGHQVRCAADGEAGLQLHQAQPAELVLCDLMLPGRNGLGVLEELQRLPQPPCCILMSGSGNGQGALTNFAIRAKELGAVAVLHKPFPLTTLTSTVRVALGQ